MASSFSWRRFIFFSSTRRRSDATAAIAAAAAWAIPARSSEWAATSTYVRPTAKVGLSEGWRVVPWKSVRLTTMNDGDDSRRFQLCGSCATADDAARGIPTAHATAAAGANATATPAGTLLDAAATAAHANAATSSLSATAPDSFCRRTCPALAIAVGTSEHRAFTGVFWRSFGRSCTGIA